MWKGWGPHWQGSKILSWGLQPALVQAKDVRALCLAAAGGHQRMFTSFLCSVLRGPEQVPCQGMRDVFSFTPLITQAVPLCQLF